MNTCSARVTIREAIASDANQATTIHIKAWQQSYKGIIEEPNLIHLVALYKEKLLAFAMQGMLLKVVQITLAKSMLFTYLKNSKDQVSGSNFLKEPMNF